MIYGIGTPAFKHIFNSSNSSILHLTLPNNPHTCISKFNEPELIKQKAIDGSNIVKLLGYRHKFTIQLYNVDAKIIEFFEMIRENKETYFYPHYDDNKDFVFKVNIVSNPFYLSNINGLSSIEINIETITYEDMVILEDEIIDNKEI